MPVDRKAGPGMYSQTSAASGIGVTLLPFLPLLLSAAKLKLIRGKGIPD